MKAKPKLEWKPQDIGAARSVRHLLGKAKPWIPRTHVTCATSNTAGRAEPLKLTLRDEMMPP